MLFLLSRSTLCPWLSGFISELQFWDPTFIYLMPRGTWNDFMWLWSLLKCLVHQWLSCASTTVLNSFVDGQRWKIQSGMAKSPAFPYIFQSLPTVRALTVRTDCLLSHRLRLCETAVEPYGTRCFSKVNVITGQTLRLFSCKLRLLYHSKSVNASRHWWVGTHFWISFLQ